MLSVYLASKKDWQIGYKAHNLSLQYDGEKKRSLPLSSGVMWRNNEKS